MVRSAIFARLEHRKSDISDLRIINLPISG